MKIIAHNLTFGVILTLLILMTGPTFFFVFPYVLALISKKLRTMRNENKAVGRKAPLTAAIILDLSRQEYLKKRGLSEIGTDLAKLKQEYKWYQENGKREEYAIEREKALLEEMEKQYGEIPEWLKPHISQNLGEELTKMGEEIKSIREDIAVIREQKMLMIG